MNKKQLNKISKYLSYILRHKPESINLKLCEEGWAVIDELIEKTTDFDLTKEIIDNVVETNNKQRFDINGRMIRANQGHTIKVDLDLKPIKPPKTLFHGTTIRFIDSIKKEGLTKQKRHHVHLSYSISISFSVGQRHGKPAVIFILADKMYEDGYKFYKSKNDVWLVDNVPIKYFKEIIYK